MNKRCFFYWGGKKLSLLNAISIISFKKYNPDYKIILYKPTINYDVATWTSHEQKIKYSEMDFSHIIVPFIDEIKYIDLTEIGFTNEIHHAQKADILRLWLLLNEGGWWSDMDVIWVKSISEFQLEENYDLGICLRNGYHSSGILYSKPNTNFYKKIFEEIKNNFCKSDYQSAGPGLLNLLFPNIESIQISQENIKVFNFELYNFYPLDSINYHLLYEVGSDQEILTNGVYGVHWYNGGTVSGNFINNFNLLDIKNSNILIYKIINSKIGFEEIEKYCK